MTTIELHLTDGQTLTQTEVPDGLTVLRDGIAKSIGTGGAINLNGPSGVRVVNSAHVLYAVVTP